MGKIFRCIGYGVIALVLAWLPVVLATVLAVRGDLGTWSECMRREWKGWIDTLDEMTA